MSIDGIGPIVPPVVLPPVQDAAAPPMRAEVVEEQQAVAPPKGVDPDLWSVLTREEQSYFADQMVLGPLTYGPSQDPGVTSAPRGQRIDVRA